MGLSASPRKICVISHGGTKNLGDEALFATVVQNTRLRIPDAEIIGFTISPEDTRQRHGIPCFPVRRSENPVESQTDSAMEIPAPLSATSSPAPVGGGEKIKSALKSIPDFVHSYRSCAASPKDLLTFWRNRNS